MMIEEDLYTYLTASTAVTAATGNKIRPLGAHENDALPYVVYERLSTDNPIHLGAGTTRANTRIVYDCYATTYSSSQSMSDALYNRLHGTTGAVGNTAFDSIFVENKFDDAIPPAEGSDQWTYVASLTLNTWHAVTVPSS